MTLDFFIIFNNFTISRKLMFKVWDNINKVWDNINRKIFTRMYPSP